MIWIQAHWPVIVSIAGALYTLLSIINGLIQNPEAKGILGKLLDGLSFLSRAAAPGTVKAPLTMSKAPGKLEVPPAAVLLVLAFLLPLAACAHVKAIGIDIGKCVIGQVPSAVAGIVPDVSAILGGTAVDWGQQLTAIGSRAGVDALACAIQSIVGELQAKRAALDPVGLRKLDRGQLYLAAHPVK